MNYAVIQPVWEKAISLAKLEKSSKAVVKLSGKQILLIKAGSAVYALNNRCPHEGFPLSEGTLSDDPEASEGLHPYLQLAFMAVQT